MSNALGYARRQRGLALVTALLVAALATLLAANMVFEIHLDIRRTESLVRDAQAKQYALGAEAWAALVLRDDRLEESTNQDALDELWMSPIAVPVDGGTVSGQLEDLQGRFNLNNLITQTGDINEPAVEQFQRLLDALELDPRLASMVADWLDLNQEPTFPDGAEDTVYTIRDVPYRTANMRITDTSELLAVNAFDLDTYRRLEPFVTALPIGTPININTAKAPVLLSLGEDLNIDAILERQCDGGYGSVTEAEDVLNAPLEDISVYSAYFGLRVHTAIGSHQLNLYSLLARDAGGETQPMLRRFGSEAPYAPEPCPTSAPIG